MAKKLLVGLLVPALVSVSGLVLLYLLTKKDEEDDEVNPGNETGKQIVIEMPIPRDHIGAVIGRSGANIKGVEQKSCTRIHFKDIEGDADRICVIRGTQEDCEHAKALIYQVISNQPTMHTAEMWVPQQACGRIIGRSGDTIRLITRMSKARVTVESHSGSVKDNGQKRLVTIRGTTDQVEVAKKLIEEKVAEEELLRHRIQQSVSSRSPRSNSKGSKKLQFLTEKEEESERQIAQEQEETLVSNNSDGFMEVYVSAVENAGHFWVQVVGPRAIELDKLVETMTQYYDQDNSRAQHVLSEVNVGDIVAAPFNHDKSWYRARVTEVQVDEYDNKESKISVYYLDYGDSGVLAQKEIRELRTDFLQLRFQAIECYLAKVIPRGDIWTPEAIELFEELSHSAQWKIVMASVVQYKEKEPDGVMVPCIELVDTVSGPQDINVGAELVRQGFAEWECKPTTVNSNGNGTSETMTEDTSNDV